MSDLFLDTQLDQAALDHIVQELRAAPFDVVVLDKIFIDEVCPVCLPNLLSLAGEWAGFDRADVVARCAAVAAAPGAFAAPRRWMRRRIARRLVPQWQAIHAQLSQYAL